MERIKQCLINYPQNDLAIILERAGKAAIAAGAIIRENYGKPVRIDRKGVIDLVTEVDTASERMILETLNAEKYGEQVLAEESSDLGTTMPGGMCWIIDPLDGTTNFAHSFPWFAVSIGYAVDGEIKGGVIYNPVKEELFCGFKGSGAWLNGKKIQVSKVPDLEQSLLATGFPYTIRQDADFVLATIKEALLQTQGVRRAGAAALDLAYVACGRLDGFWEFRLKPWDTAAGILLIEEAGGAVTDLKGGEYNPFLPEILSSNKRIHSLLVEILGKYSLI